MSGKIDKETVNKAAHLSRLNLSSDEIDKFSVQLNSVIEYIDKLNEVNTENVPPTSHTAGDVKNVFREDFVKESLEVDKALKNAPKRIGDFFGVPKIIE